MSRKFILDGDYPYGGGRVNARPAPFPFTVDGKNVSHEGDPVYCEKCRSTGFTKCVPPYWPVTTSAGRPNLDGDLCICRCPVPPRLIARREAFAGHAFEEGRIAEMQGSEGWQAYKGHIKETSFHDEQYILRDSSGKVMKNFAYTVRYKSTGDLVRGMTDEHGFTERIRTPDGRLDSIELMWGHK